MELKVSVQASTARGLQRERLCVSLLVRVSLYRMGFGCLDMDPWYSLRWSIPAGLRVTWHSRKTPPLLEQQVDTKQYFPVPVMDLEPAEVARTHLTAISVGHGSQKLCAMSSSLVHTLDFLRHLKQ